MSVDFTVEELALLLSLVEFELSHFSGAQKMPSESYSKNLALYSSVKEKLEKGRPLVFASHVLG